MLDLARRVQLAGIPGAIVFADHEDEDTFYAIPQTPTLDEEDEGRPAIRLVLYVQREKEDGPDVVTGGQLTLTTRLDLDLSTLAAVTEALRHHRLSSPRAGRPVQVTQPPWTGGTVDVRLTELLSAAGQPSLFGGNRCAMSRSLTADEGDALKHAWEQKLPEGRIVYRMQVDAMISGGSRSTVVEQRTSEAHDLTSRAAHEFTLSLDAAAAHNQSIAIEGPLWNDNVERALSTIDVSR